MATVIEEKKEVNTLNVLIEERKREAIKKIAPRVIELVMLAGVRNETGWRLNQDIAHFEYNEMTGVVSVFQGPNACMYVNLDKNRCSLVKDGTWKLILDSLYRERVEGRNLEEEKRKQESKFRENFGAR